MCGYRWFSKTRKYRSRRTSMLDGCTMSMAYGSSPMWPASTSALMSRSESSMPGHYRGKQQLAAARDLKPVVTDGYDRALTNADHFARLAARRHPVGGRHCRAVGRSAVDDIHPTGVQ